MKPFSLIAALDENRGIGIRNAMPWHLKGDFKHFVKETSGGTVIMGRKTWESLPEAFRPLKNRLNIVLTRQADLQMPKGVLVVDSLESALAKSQGKTFVIGGAALFAEAILHPACQQLILTEIDATFECDAFFPEIPQAFQIQKKISEQENELHYQFVYYQKQ